MFLIKIYIEESYINYYHTIIQMCGQYCILAPRKPSLKKSNNCNYFCFLSFSTKILYTFTLLTHIAADRK